MTTLTTATRGHLLRIADLDAAGLEALLDLAAAFKRDPLRCRNTLAGMSVACYFSKPSTRTRVSFEAAAWRLGALPIMLRPDELQLGRGELISDTARVLGSYASAIVIRTFEHADVEAVAASSGVPVINALTDDHHPCQALADLLTLREHFGTLEGLRVAYIGDGNNVAHSLMEAGAIAGMEVTIGCPRGYEPDPAVVAAAREAADRSGGAIWITNDPIEAAGGARAVYADVWVSMGDEAEQTERYRTFGPHRIDGRLMAAASHDAVFMHCLPAHRGFEVTADVIDGPQSVVFRQAANRLPTAQAVLYALVTGDWGEGRCGS